MAASMPIGGRVAEKWRKTGPFIKYGIPLISLCVLGFEGLVHMLEGRADIVRTRNERQWATIGVDPTNPPSSFEKLSELNAKQKSKMDLEGELKSMKEKIDINTYENKPVWKPKS